MLGSKKMMVGLVVALLSTAACATDPDVKPDGSEFKRQEGINPSVRPLWRYCHEENSTSLKPTLKQYVDSSSVFFIGKAVERRLKLNELRSEPFNGCWVRFKIQETLKGSVKDEIWVKALYNDRMQDVDIFSYKNCYLETGKKYLISGRIFQRENPSAVDLSHPKIG